MRIPLLLSLILSPAGLLGWFVHSGSVIESASANVWKPESEADATSKAASRATKLLGQESASKQPHNAQPLIDLALGSNQAEPTFLAAAHGEAAINRPAVSKATGKAIGKKEAARSVQPSPFAPITIDRLKVKEIVANGFSVQPSAASTVEPFSIRPPYALSLAAPSVALPASASFTSSAPARSSPPSSAPSSATTEPTGSSFSQDQHSTGGVTVAELPVLSPPPMDAPVGPSFRQPMSLPPLSTGVDENYILGPGDIIEVNFFNVPEYSGQHRLSTSGTIDLPLIGRVSLQGMTVSQASRAIANRYLSQLQTPIVAINVLQQRPLQIAISGEIAQPGLYTLGAQGAEYPRLFQALQQAGGLTQSADLTQVEVRRKGADGTQTTLRVNLLALLQDGDIDQNIFLQDGDAIRIPSSTQMDMIALNQLSGSNLRTSLNQPLDIAVVGEVTQPGPYQLETEGGGRVTLVQALQKAGGITPSANLREVQLRRQTRNGVGQLFDINLWELLQDGDLNQDLVLQQGDTIFVPTASEPSLEEVYTLASSSLSTGTIQVNIVGEVESPGERQVRANTSFNQALLASGGLNRRAQKDAMLVRFNPNGTVERRAIKVDLSEDINPETNPILRPNDVIVVGRSVRAAFDDSISGFSNTFNLVWPFLFLF